eukprot:scaffold6438_cov181-Amphora_coffeaeformis.AAC.3
MYLRHRLRSPKNLSVRSANNFLAERQVQRAKDLEDLLHINKPRRGGIVVPVSIQQPASMSSQSSLQHTREGEHHGDYDNTPVTITRSTYLFAFCAAINSCNRK